MNKMTDMYKGLFFTLMISLILGSCTRKAGNPEEASQILMAAPEWFIEEITVNNVVTFKEGKMIEQFGGVNFERYMEIVSFKADGSFEGYFKGEVKPMTLNWKLNANDITVVAGDEKGGAWTIIPGDVTEDYFVMKTQSTAYDYPRMTKIALKFKKRK
jgi:hypothetical protein